MGRNKIKIVQFSHNPLAGAPYQIYVCLSQYSNILETRLVNWKVKYLDGRSFPYDMLYSNPYAKEIIKQADIIHIHNQLPGYLQKIINKRKQKVFATLHSVPRLYNWKELIQFADKTFVIRQPYQIKEYKKEGLISLPTPVDIYNPSLKPLEKKEEKIVINFAPSNNYPINHPASKGKKVVVQILNKLKQKYPNKVAIDVYSNLSQREDFSRKKLSDIVIDDVVHPTFHLTSLFGLSLGTIVVTGIDEQEFVEYYGKNFKKNCKSSPFVKSSLKDLYNVLEEIVNYKREQIEKMKKKSRKWIEEFYNPKDIIKEYEKIYTNTTIGGKTMAVVLKTIRKLYKKYEGKDIYIFGNGPSLTKINPEDFKDKICFGINYSFEKMPYMDYIFVQEVETYEIIKNIIDPSKLIIPVELNFHGTTLRKKIYNKDSYYYNLQNPLVGDLNKKKLSLDIGAESEIFSYSTTTHSAIHIAAYMGAKNIFLIGVDYKLFPNGKVHYESKYDKKYHKQMTINTLKKHKKGDEWLKEKLKEYGINLINLSEGILQNEKKKNINVGEIIHQKANENKNKFSKKEEIILETTKICNRKMNLYYSEEFYKKVIEIYEKTKEKIGE